MGNKLEHSYINLTTGETEQVEVNAMDDELENDDYAGIDIEDDDDWLDDDDDTGKALTFALIFSTIVIAIIGIICLFDKKD